MLGTYRNDSAGAERGSNWRLTGGLGKVCKKKGDGNKQGERSSLAPHITPACGETVPQELVTRHRQLMMTSWEGASVYSVPLLLGLTKGH